MVITQGEMVLCTMVITQGEMVLCTMVITQGEMVTCMCFKRVLVLCFIKLPHHAKWFVFYTIIIPCEWFSV